MGFLFGGSGGTSQTGGSSSSASTNFTPEYNNYVNNILAKSQALGETPFQPYDISKMFAPFSADQQQAFNQVRQGQGAWQPYGQQATGALNRVGGAGYDPLQNASPFLNRAAQTPDPWQAGQGYLRQGAQQWGPQQAQSYMNPFAEGAINRANDVSSRNFFEKTIPGINDQFVKSGGGLGRGRYGEFMNRAVRDFANEQTGNAQTTMAGNYWQGANQFNNDMSRMGQTGTSLGNLASGSMGALGNLGSQVSNITSGAVNSGVGLSGAYSNLGGALSNLNLTNSNALLQSGNQQQQQAQQPLTAAYNQFQQQVQWPFQMVNFMNAAQRGLQIPTTQNTNTNQWQNTSQGSSPSIMGGILGTAGALGSLFTPGAGGTSAGGNILSGLGGMFGGGGGSQVGGYTLAGNTAPTNVSGIGVRRGGQINRYAQGGQAFGPIVEPRGVFNRRAVPRRFAVGGSVPMVRGLRHSTMEATQRRGPMPGGPQGALSGSPQGGPPMMPPPGMMPGGALRRMG